METLIVIHFTIMNKRMDERSKKFAITRITDREAELLEMTAVAMTKALGKPISKSDVLRGGITLLGTITASGEGYQPRQFPWK